MKTTNNVKRGVLVGGVVLLLVLTVAGLAAAQVCVLPPSGLVSWWPGDGNANDIRDGNPGTLQGGATFGVAEVGQGFIFSAADGERVVVPHAPNLNLESVLQATFEGWFKSAGGVPIPGDPNTDKIIVAKHTCGFNNGWFFTTAQGCFFGDIGAGMGNAGINLNDGQFHHFACVKDSTTYRQYIDGVLVITKSGPAFGTPNTESVQMGGLTAGSCNNFGQLNGAVDEVAVFHKALTTAEVQAIFNAGSAGKCKITTVTIDIKPGSFPNSINPRSQGVIPVAILTTDSFDATTVDSTTVRFGPTGTEAAPVYAALEDVDLDGDSDMILHFNTQATGIQCGDTSASLTGQTLSGQAIEGSDSINTVGCN